MRRILALVTLVAIVACGGDSPTGPSASPAGTYSLRTINSASLPWTVPGSTATDKFEFLAGNITLNADGTYSESTTYRVTEGTTVTTDTDSYLGAWTRNGDNITVTAVGMGSYSLAWTGGNTLTQVEQGFTLVYRK